MIVNTRQKIHEYLAEHISDQTLNASAIGRHVNASRQRVCQILDQLGETRHKRSIRRDRYVCRICNTPISKTAVYCRKHSVKRTIRKEGFNYMCRSCHQYRPLEQFARSNKHYSGYETRCLACKAEWQRRYTQTSKGKESHRKANQKSARQHPERIRAYYQVYRAIKIGTLVKASRCEHETCDNPDVRAVHADYSTPLNVRWLCSLHTLRQNKPKSTYTPNLLETNLRDFVFIQTSHNNSASRWINTLKTHYDVTTVTYSILLAALRDEAGIPGLGRKFKTRIREFLDHTIKTLDLDKSL